MEAMLLDILVYLLGTLCQTLSNAVHTVYLLLDVIENIFTSFITSTSSMFKVVTVNIAP